MRGKTGTVYCDSCILIALLPLSGNVAGAYPLPIIKPPPPPVRVMPGLLE